MGRLLKDADGRRLLLAEWAKVESNVLLIHGQPLLLLDDPQDLEPRLLDAIALAVPGAVVTSARDRRSRDCD